MAKIRSNIFSDMWERMITALMVMGLSLLIYALAEATGEDFPEHDRYRYFARIRDVLAISNDEELIEKVTRYGLAGGLSTGANLAAALTLAARPEMQGRRIVTLAPSPAERYGASMLFDPIDEADLGRRT